MMNLIASWVRRLMSKDLSKYRVALVVGHEKKKQGTRNNVTGESEFVFNEKVVGQIAPIISKFCECHIVYREGGVSDEIDKVNSLNANLAIAFHCNGFDQKASGSEVLFYHTSTKGGKFASIMLKHIVKALGLKDRGIKPKEESHRGGKFLKKTNCFSLIVEPFFLDNDGDLQIANKNYNNLLCAYTNGIRECLETLDKETK